MAICAVLTVILVPSARAQRVEPEVHAVDASVHAGVDEHAREQSPSKKNGVRHAAGSAWTVPATQPSRNIVRPTSSATTDPSTSASVPTSAALRASVLVNAVKPIPVSRPESDNAMASRRIGSYPALPHDNLTQSRSYTRRIRKKPSPKNAQK